MRAPVGGLRTLAAIAAGGCVGGLARYGVASALPHDADGWPWSTLTVNLIGAFALALLFAVVDARASRNPYVVPMLGSGLIGGFTTFSTWMLDVDTMARAGAAWAALAYLATTLVGGLLLAVVGLAVGRVLTSRGPGPAAGTP